MILNQIQNDATLIVTVIPELNSGQALINPPAGGQNLFGNIVI